MYVSAYMFICDEFLYLFVNLADILPNAVQGREGLSRFILRGGTAHGGRKVATAGEKSEHTALRASIDKHCVWDPSLWNGAAHIYDGVSLI